MRAKHLPPVLVDFFFRGAGAVLGEQTVCGFLGLQGLPSRLFGHFAGGLAVKCPRNDLAEVAFRGHMCRPRLRLKRRGVLLRQINGHIYNNLHSFFLQGTPNGTGKPGPWQIQKLPVNVRSRPRGRVPRVRSVSGTNRALRGRKSQSGSRR